MATAAEQQKQLVEKAVKLPKYNGDKQGQTVDAWITTAVLRLTMAGIDDDEVMAKYITANGLIGRAMEWITPYLLQPKDTWDTNTHPCCKVENLRAVLRQRTGQDEKREIAALKEILTLKQRGRKIQAYIQDYLTLKAELPADLKANKMALARFYYTGLDKHIPTQLAANADIEIWEDTNWIRRTKQMEEFKISNQFKNNKWNPKQYKLTNKYVDPNAMEVDKTKIGKRTNKGNSKDKCYKCGKPGHWAKDCYSKGNQQDLGVNTTRYIPKRKNNKFKKNKLHNRKGRKPFGRKGAYIDTEDIKSEQDFQ